MWNKNLENEGGDERNEGGHEAELKREERRTFRRLCFLCDEEETGRALQKNCLSVNLNLEIVVDSREKI